MPLKKENSSNHHHADSAKYHSIKRTMDPAHWGYEFDNYLFIDEEQMPLGLK